MLWNVLDIKQHVSDAHTRVLFEVFPEEGIQEGRDEKSEKNVEERTREVETQWMTRAKQSMTLTQGDVQLATVAYVYLLGRKPSSEKPGAPIPVSSQQ